MEGAAPGVGAGSRKTKRQLKLTACPGYTFLPGSAKVKSSEPSGAAASPQNSAALIKFVTTNANTTRDVNTRPETDTRPPVNQTSFMQMRGGSNNNGLKGYFR